MMLQPQGAVTVQLTPLLPLGKIKAVLRDLPVFQGQKSGVLCEIIQLEKVYNCFKNKTHLRTYCIAQGTILNIL